MAPLNWIHCSLCYRLLVKKEHKFFHLSCRHILCRPCMAKTNRGTVCPVCRGTLKRFAELNNQMERKDKMWYDPSAARIFDIACQTLIFQQKHREHLIQRILLARSSLPRLNDLVGQLRGHIVETQRRYEKLRTFRRSLQENLRGSMPLAASGMSQSLLTPAFSIRPSGQFKAPARRMSTESTFGSVQSQRSATNETINGSMTSITRTPAFPTAAGQFRVPARRLSTESALSSLQPPRKATIHSHNGSFGVQQFATGKISHRRLSNDSGIGAITPCNDSFVGSAKRGGSCNARGRLPLDTFNRSTFNTSVRD